MSTTVLHLYDLYNVCVSGFEIEDKVFKLYAAMIAEADAVLVNSEPFGAFEPFAAQGKSIISLLRYPPSSPARSRPPPGAFRIVMITGFLGEHDDPTRRTEKAVRRLLGQGAHIHYFSQDEKAQRFSQMARTEFPQQFHLHRPILVQSELVSEISRYDAGWAVVDMRPFSDLDANFSTSFAQELARKFVFSSFPTAGLLYAAAGLPIFANPESYIIQACAEGVVIPVELTEDGDLSGGRIAYEEMDWESARKKAFRARESFFMDRHISVLSSYLTKASPPPSRPFEWA